MTNEFRQQADHYRDALLAAAQEKDIDLRPPFPEDAEMVLGLSDFVAQSCIRDPAILKSLSVSGDLQRKYRRGTIADRLRTIIQPLQTTEELALALRRFRRREMVRIAWRDLTSRAKPMESMADLTELAEACLEYGLAKLYTWLGKEFGLPYSPAGQRQRLVVIGMGKLGARELNFSSDIDLIFSYPEPGHTKGAAKSATNEAFFNRLARKLIETIGATTAEGFVFRVDMRLRPYGENGPLVMNFDNMEEYYQSQGREWERYAWIKARVVAGNKKAGARLMKIMQPFIYRRYIDFGVFDSLRAMKHLIENEVRRRHLHNDVKLGAGGIREIEFIGQAFQLLRGGRFPALRERGILKVLAVLASNQFLPPVMCDELRQAYLFLRRTEHYLQEFGDKQTHALPEDRLGRMRLATAMGYSSWRQYEEVLHSHRRRVHAGFLMLFEGPKTAEEKMQGGRHEETFALWLGNLEQRRAVEILKAIGMQDPLLVWHQLEELKNSHQVRTLSSQGRDRLDRLMPAALLVIAEQGGTIEAVTRFISLLEAIVRRSAYLALLNENPGALHHLVQLFKASPIIATLVTRHPLLLDELLDPRSLYAPPDRKVLAVELRQRLSRFSIDDFEQLLDEFRGFKHANVLRVAAADITGIVPVMKVSDHLTFIAEVIVEAALLLAWEQMAREFGLPGKPGKGRRSTVQGFAVIAYGKFGGIELGYGSDLDLIFLRADDLSGHPAPGAGIDIGRFYNRLGQRFVHVLTVHTSGGVLYDVDLRLRPDGGSGPLLTTIASFLEYQTDKAWTWEHQALVRARVVAGDPALGARFAEVRKQILTLPREEAVLKEEILTMRERMRQKRKKEKHGRFDLKNDPGGIVDIEFLVQYLILLEACRYPELTTWTDNVRQLETISQCGLLTTMEADLLTEAYLAFRTAVHHRSLQGKNEEVDGMEFQELRKGVQGLWQKLLPGPALAGPGNK